MLFRGVLPKEPYLKRSLSDRFLAVRELVPRPRALDPRSHHLSILPPEALSSFGNQMGVEDKKALAQWK